jgi:hypothetical protein
MIGIVNNFLLKINQIHLLKNRGIMGKVKWMSSLVIGVVCASLTGCASLTVGTDRNPPQLKSKGILNGYMACNGFRPYDGKILEAGILSDNDRWGDMVSLDIWPIGGFGVSFIGAKMKLLPFDIGLGVLGYNPKPEFYTKPHKPEKKCEEK